MVDFGKLPKGTIRDARRGLIVRFGKKEGQYPCEGSKRLSRCLKGSSEVRRESKPYKKPPRGIPPREGIGLEQKGC